MAETCREAILGAFARLESRYGRADFSLEDVVLEVLADRDQFTERTIRTQITSRMCVQAPKNHGTVYADLDRAARGRYRRRT
jgi:hypothetical protein